MTAVTSMAVVVGPAVRSLQEVLIVPVIQKALDPLRARAETILLGFRGDLIRPTGRPIDLLQVSARSRRRQMLETLL